MDPQQFAQFLAVVRESLVRKEETPRRRRLGESKEFSKAEKFSGDERVWKEWSENFKVIIKGANLRMWDTIRKVEASSGRYEEGQVGQWKVACGNEEEQAWFVETGAELYEQMCLHTTGEAAVLVRGAEEQNGYVAWKKLVGRYDAKTPSGFLKSLMEVLKPGEVKDAREVPRMLEVWDGRIRALAEKHQEVISDRIKTAVFVGLLPKDLQEEVYRQIGSGEIDYRRTRDNIVGIVENRIARGAPAPVPMEIGQLKVGVNEEEEASIDAVGDGRCHRCGGVGHFARECATPKGKGKEGKGGKGNFGSKDGRGSAWKGDGKGKGEFAWKEGKGEKGWKGNMWKGDGKGKGFGKDGKGKGALVCYNCGGTGHKADTCWSPKRVQGIQGYEEEGETAEDEVQVIGGIWEIGAVECEVCWGESGYGMCGIGHPLLYNAMERVGEVACGIEVKVGGGEDDEDLEEIDVAGILAGESGDEDLRRDEDEEDEKGGEEEIDERIEKLASRRRRTVGISEEAEVIEVETMKTRRCRERKEKKKMKKKAKKDRKRQGKEAEEDVWVYQVNKRWERVGKGEVTIDSAAEESVCPLEWGHEEFGMDEVQKKMRFRNASGGKMGHYGKRSATFTAGGNSERILGMDFQVSDVQKPLAAVWRVADAGNIVQFGPKAEDNFVKSVKTGEKMMMKKKGGSYVIEVEFVSKAKDDSFTRPVPK